MRVVVTAASVACPLGSTLDDVAKAVSSGSSGIRRFDHVEDAGILATIGGKIRGWTNATDTLKMRALCAHLADDVMRQVGGSVAPPMRFATSIAVGRAPLGLDNIRRAADAQFEQSRDCDAIVRMIRSHVGAGGRALCPATACASGNDAIGLGMLMIRRGRADAVLCGAVDTQLAAISLLEFDLLKALVPIESSEIDQPRPFSKDRQGFVMGEGGALLMLESEEHARQRRARIFGEIAGYGASSDAYSLLRGCADARGAVDAMLEALISADVTPAAIDYVNAHGTGTRVNDALEVVAIKKVFGSRARKLPVSSTKSMTGHLLSSAAAVEAVLCLIAMNASVLPPTINYHEFDPDCDIDCVANVARHADLSNVMSNAFGFGGHNSVLILRRAA